MRILIKVQGHYAILNRGARAPPQPNRRGLTWTYKEIEETTAPRLTKLLAGQEPRVIHLCRQVPCPDAAKHSIHAESYMEVGADENPPLQAMRT